jgi:small subunit ribosomal protein S6
MPLYESTFIVRQDVSAHDVEKLTDSFIKIIQDNGGKLIKKESWGLRDLAYTIRKNNKGHYVMLGIEAGHAAINELERRIKLSEDVLRHLTVRVESIDPKASIIIDSSDENNIVLEQLDKIDAEE